MQTPAGGPLGFPGPAFLEAPVPGRLAVPDLVIGMLAHAALLSRRRDGRTPRSDVTARLLADQDLPNDECQVRLTSISVLRPWPAVDLGQALSQARDRGSLLQQRTPSRRRRGSGSQALG